MKTSAETTLFFLWTCLRAGARVEARRLYVQKYHQSERGRRWEKRNPEKMAANKRRYHEKNNAEVIARASKWNKENSVSRNARTQVRRLLEPAFRLEQNLRARIRGAVKEGRKAAKTLDLLGCSIEQLRSHLELKFTPGMTWENYGEWEVDHVRPCSSFDLIDSGQQKLCFNFSNLQPLWAGDNRRKGASCQ